jgi:putative oxidoreductase
MNSRLINRIFSTRPGWAPLVVRIPLAIIFIGHGAQKLFGWFGGYGLGGTAQYMDSIGLSPGIVLASLAGGAEFFGGLALLLGLLVRPASVALAFTMLVAIFSVHISKGLFLSNGGFEYGLALLAVTVALVISGAGRFSLDRALARNVSPAHS